MSCKQNKVQKIHLRQRQALKFSRFIFTIHKVYMLLKTEKPFSFVDKKKSLLKNPYL